jgi:hypothetical protein
MQQFVKAGTRGCSCALSLQRADRLAIAILSTLNRCIQDLHATVSKLVSALTHSRAAGPPTIHSTPMLREGWSGVFVTNNVEQGSSVLAG